METQVEKHKPAISQLIYVPHKDTVRLLEVYVRRSLSLNDGTLGRRHAQKKEKWVTIPKRRLRRHSSDPSLHLSDPSDEREIVEFSAINPPEIPPEPCVEESEKTKRKSKKNKKPSFWKNLLEIFSRKTGEDKDEEQEIPAEAPEPSDAAVTCRPTTPVLPQKKVSRKKSLKRRFSKRKLSLMKNKSSKEFNAADITSVEAVSVEATYSYYENVSAELEKIVHEVKVKEEDQPLSNEELINRIIALTKEQGDAIDVKLKEHPTLNSFFQGITYSSFQKLADAYLEEEVTPTTSPVTVPPTAPELVKLAFTLDFTARIASLSRQNVGYITKLGNRYLQDRFEYTQACTDHPWSDNED